MTRLEWNKAFYCKYNTFAFRHQIWKTNGNYLKARTPQEIVWEYLWLDSAQRDYLTERDDMITDDQISTHYGFNVFKPIELVCCDTPVPCKSMSYPDSMLEPLLDKMLELATNPPLVVSQKQEDTTMYPTSKNSMPTVTDLTINMAPAASASISTKTDIQHQREHLLGRLKGIEESYRWGEMSNTLREAFNLDADNTPKTARALIEAIKGGKYKLDDRIADLQDKGATYDPVDDEYIRSPLVGLAFDGPTPDNDGYTKARETFSEMVKDAKDTIIVKSPEEGLTAIQALDAWKPTGKAN